MSNASIAAEVHKIEETVKEELVKASMHLRDQFQEQLNMERQDRHQDNELFARKMFAAEATIAELQKAMAGYATILENVKLEAARQSAVHADFIQQHMGVDQSSKLTAIAAENETLRLKLSKVESSLEDLQRAGGAISPQGFSMYSELHGHLMAMTVDQSSELTAIAAENETLRLKLSKVESSVEDLQRAGGARSPQGFSIHSELHGHLMAMWDTLSQLRSDVAVQSSLNTDYLSQQAGLEILRKEVSTLKLCTTPAAATMNESLEQSIRKLRADMEKKFTYLERQTYTGIVSTIADTLSQLFADSMHKAERVDKLIEGGQFTNMAGADGKQEINQRKERDVIFDNFVAVGEWSAAKEEASEDTPPTPEGISTDPETVWMPVDLKRSLATLVDIVQKKLKTQAIAPASVQAKISEGTGGVDTQSRGSSPHFSRGQAESPRLPDDSLLQTWPSCNSPTRTPTSVPPGTSQYTSVGRRDNSTATVPTTAIASLTGLSEQAVLCVGMQARSGSLPFSTRSGSLSTPAPLPNKDLGKMNQFAAGKASQSPEGMSRSFAYGGGGRHTLGSEGGGVLKKARMTSPVSARGLSGSAGRSSSNQHSLVGVAASAFRRSSCNRPASPESVTPSLEGGPAGRRGMSSPKPRTVGPAFGGSSQLEVQSQPLTKSTSRILI